MGLRFFRRLKILPGVTVNLSRSGVSTSIGTKGAHVTLGHGQVRETVGVSGSGLSYTHVETHGEAAAAEQAPAVAKHGAIYYVLAAVLAVAIIAAIFATYRAQL